MLTLSKNLYIVDDLKWAFIDAILNKRTNEAIFWLNEYYISGYEKESWQLLFATYCCFYYKNYDQYFKVLIKHYKNWKKNRSFMPLLEVTYKFYKWQTIDSEIFKIVFTSLKCKKVSCELPKTMYKKYDLCEKNIFVNLLKSLQEGRFKNVWFFIQLNFDKTSLIIEKYYPKAIKYHIEDIIDVKLQLLMHVMKQSFKSEKKKKIFKIKINEGCLKYYNSLKEENSKPLYSYLKRVRQFKIPDTIGCFRLKRYKYDYDKIVENYLGNWEAMAFNSPLWRSRFEKYGGNVNESGEIVFPDEELEEKFYEEYNLEPDEQNMETHMKSVCKIKKYSIKKWVKQLNCV